MKSFLNSIASVAAVLACLTFTEGCRKVDPVIEENFTHVAIYYGCGYNNLSESLKDNVVKELASGEIPERYSGKAMLAFCHNTAGSRNYEDSNPPVLIRLFKENGKTVIDTVKTYPMMTVSASAATLTSVLNEIKDTYKSDSYGLIFSSHATGWLPEGYRSPEDKDSKAMAPTSIGAQFRGSDKVSTEIDIKDFADAIPYPMDFIILDCCLSGSVEVACELKDVCDYIVFSPTEILGTGYDYENMAKRIFSTPADLKGICDDHYAKYARSSTNYSTTTVVDCSQIDEVADAVKSILCVHRQEFLNMQAINVSKRTVQRYFYQTDYYTFFYDLRHLAVKIGASEGELAGLDAALKQFVVYEKHTNIFLKGLKLDNVCGVSMYIPHNKWSTLNSYYKELGWNNQVKVLEN